MPTMAAGTNQARQILEHGYPNTDIVQHLIARSFRYFFQRHSIAGTHKGDELGNIYAAPAKSKF